MTWNKKASAYTFDEMAFPLVVEVAKPTDVLAFVSENADDVKRAIQDHGAILLRGFGSSEEQTLSNILQVVWAKPISYTYRSCLLYTSPSPRDQRGSRMPSSA